MRWQMFECIWRIKSQWREKMTGSSLARKMKGRGQRMTEGKKAGRVQMGRSEEETEEEGKDKEGKTDWSLALQISC